MEKKGKQKEIKDKTKYKTEKKVVYKKVKKKRFKLKIHTILIVLLLIYLSIYFIHDLINKPVTNIYISGNTYYSDWDIIEKAGLEDYPASLSYPSSKIENSLEKDIFIKSATVKKTFFTRVYITVEENKPLFYDAIKSKTILANGDEIDDKFDIPTLENEMNKDVYNDFIKCMNAVSNDVFLKISEIKYAPDEVDKEKILFTMNDGNYVYVTILKFDLINKYNDIVKTFNNKKGILYLNSGGYFEITQN